MDSSHQNSSYPSSPFTPKNKRKHTRDSATSGKKSPLSGFGRISEHNSSAEEEDLLAAYELDVVEEKQHHQHNGGRHFRLASKAERGGGAQFPTYGSPMAPINGRRESALSPISLEALSPRFADRRSSTGVSPNDMCNYRVISLSKAPASVDTLNQSIEVVRFTFRRPGFENGLLISRFEDVLTVADSWRRSAAKFGSRKCMGVRQVVSATKSHEVDAHDKRFTWNTYDQINERVQTLCYAIHHLQLPRGNFGIWSENRVEWHLASIALSHVRHCISVPVHYDKNHPNNANFIINHSDIHTIFCSSRSLNHLLSIIHTTRKIRCIICFDELSENQKAAIREKSTIFNKVSVYSLRHLEKMGKEQNVSDSECKWDKQRPDDVTTIHYTSGTQGEAKLLTNINIVSSSSALYLAWSSSHKFDDPQVYLSYLPLDHVSERCNSQLMLDAGCAIGFWSGDSRTLRQDFLSLQPTIITASQRVCTMIQTTIHRNICRSPFLRRHFFRDGASSPYNNDQNYLHSSSLIDFLIYRRVRSRLGGKLRCICTGGSALPDNTQIYLRKSLNIPILQSFGLTETCAAGMMQLNDDTSTNTVGAPLACVEVKLRSCPDLGFLVTDDPPRGELLFRGPSVTSGYFKERNSSRHFDSSGFFCSGDVAELNANGNWTIIDRKENFMKLANDDFIVAVGQLERAYEYHPSIYRIWIHASNDHKHLVAIAVVDAEGLITFGKDHGVQTEDLEDKDVQRALLDSLDSFADRRKMLPYEKIRNIRLLRSDFAEVSSPLETSGRHLRRVNLENHFAEELEEMYAEIGDSTLG
eukprot:CAMPEP_0117453722 /NCGR_PEP_ID=MMETSP0759-20121206/10381_1 /TAXON_ID=63605 /ORGANISM="Percolomonas cosmopolitus, Strain WS" /LENGTH=811 /DNA_ID=CAMNT_0005246785 /DNA_START=502 /DNA_END=2937 /DNA_ORIENTATION=+